MLKRIVVALAVLLFILGGAAGALYYYYTGLLEPVEPAAEDEYIIVDIPSGANTETIASILEHENLIQNQFAFRYYARSRDIGHSFAAGTYRLSPSMHASRIAEIITAGDVYAETTWFTIPEGYTVKQAAEKLEAEGLVDSSIFLELAANPSETILENYPYLQDINDPQIDYLLEGYLFPDTYEIYTTADEEEIIKLMLNRMDGALNSAAAERAGELGHTLHEILTLASLVEREAAVDHERDRIAGVIHNRLAVGQRLQIDATIQYILGETKEFLTYADLEIPSPYNTYQNAGLPPGPIAAPGRASIEAALYPEDHDYFYYNYKYDGTGEHYFSYTYEEHLRNVRKAEENLP